MEVNGYYGLMLNIVLTSRLMLNLRQADQGNSAVYGTSQDTRWKAYIVSKIVDGFDDAPQSTEICMLDTVRRIRVRS